jgi:hypothetical protein
MVLLPPARAWASLAQTDFKFSPLPFFLDVFFLLPGAASPALRFLLLRFSARSTLRRAFSVMAACKSSKSLEMKLEYSDALDKRKSNCFA